MEQLNVLVERQVRHHLDVSPDEFEYLRHPSPKHLHDPFYYKDMRELVMRLHQFKRKQEEDPKLLLMVDGDYDTDGICASAILTAALSVFGFRFRVHVPSMEDGYGLGKTAIDKMRANNETHGYRIGMILTADNGIAAFSGVSYAKSLGIDVLITDHHPGKDKLPDAKAVVDANRPGDLYPFKGNSGACVAWKAMLAYAELYAKDAKPLIERLIVFAGISNVADVMPIRNENRYMVVAALRIVKDLLSESTYEAVADTPYPEYNAVFHGLYDLVTLLQQAKDEKRRKQNKKPVPLPMNEELFSWYLSPLLNAPRRVHDTCLEGLAVFLTSDMNVRRYVIRRLIELNEEKSKLRDDVINALPPKVAQPVICANTKKGISGLIAGKLAEESNLPSVVFSRFDPKSNDPIYLAVPTDGRLTGSARSNAAFPLDRIMDKMNERHPGLVTGGGHDTAAGFSIDAKNYGLFRELFIKALPEVQKEVLSESEIAMVPENEITLCALRPSVITAEYQVLTENNELVINRSQLDEKTFANDAKSVIQFLESLRPFGKDFEAETKFKLSFNRVVCDYEWDPDFWMTFKFNLFGVEVLTFEKAWADEVKKTLEKRGTVTGVGKLRLNKFHGKTIPQLVLSEK